MPTINGTSGNDSWTVVNPGTFTLNGLGGTDTLYLGTSLRSEYTITQAADGAVLVDSLSGASGVLHATLYNMEYLVFANKTDTVNLLTYFADTVAPTVTAFTPAAQATAVAPDANIVLQFSEPVTRGSGAISLQAADGTLVASYDVATSTNLTLSGATLTINPSADLGLNTTYKLVVPTGAVKDAAGNNFAGIGSYSFTTAGGYVIAGSAAAESLNGSPGNDTVSAGDGNDTIAGNGGTDRIDGGNGLDTVSFAGTLASFRLSRAGGTTTVLSKSGSAVNDTIVNVEALKFSDMTVNLGVQATAAAAPTADVQRLIELYVAFFNRMPDADGLAYWIGQKVAGASTNAIAETFYNAGVQYATLTGFSAGMGNEDFVNLVYRNVLGRPGGADAGGLAYWTGKLADGSATRGSLVSTILDSAHTFKGDATYGYVADLLDNKIAVAKTIAVDWGINYNTPADSITRGMAIAAAITPTDTASAIALVGIAPGDIVLG